MKTDEYKAAEPVGGAGWGEYYTEMMKKKKKRKS